METIVIATGNQHKVKEIKSIFKDYNVISQKEAGLDLDVYEYGNSFEANAVIKAMAVSRALNCIALADDSGICVNALGGAPGVYSARYSGAHGDDKANRALLVENLKDKKDKSAYFKSAIALVFPGGRTVIGTGVTEGEILSEGVGENGFGYDCIFFSKDLKKSFGEASDEEKNTVSHRFRALKDLRSKL